VRLRDESERMQVLIEDALWFGRLPLNDNSGQKREKNNEPYKPSRVFERSAKTIHLAIPIAPHPTPKGQLLLTGVGVEKVPFRFEWPKWGG
jgi:hypothetical protein